MVKGKKVVVITTPLARVENVKARLQTYSKLKALQALGYDAETIWLEGYTVTNRPVLIKVVGNEMWAMYEDRGDWIYAGVLKELE